MISINFNKRENSDETNLCLNPASQFLSAKYNNINSRERKGKDLIFER